MMNRISRQTSDLPRAQSALTGHARVQALLRQHLPARISTLFAAPRQIDGEAIEWLSPLEGQSQPLASLSESEGQKVRNVLDEKLAAVRELAAHLASQPEHNAQDVALLRRAAYVPKDADIYVQNGQPVITCWGDEPPPAPVVPPVIAPAALAAADTLVVRKTSRRWWWLLLLLLLLLLAGLAWWLWCPASPRAAAVVPAVESVEPVEPVKLALVAPVLPVADATVTPDKSTPLSRCIAEENAAGRGELAEKHCQNQLMANVKSLCPAERPAELAPQVVVIFDASGSMGISMDATAEEIWRLQNELPVPNVDREPRRITVARNSAVGIINQLPKDVNIGLVTAESCRVVKSSGFFTAGQRPNLVRTIKRIEPGDETALAQALRKAGQLVDGVNRDAMILLISDGDETCNGDPCAVARELKRKKPRLTVNVVDIMGTGAGNCIANTTGGKVFTANKANEVMAMMNKAVESYIPKNCQPEAK